MERELAYPAKVPGSNLVRICSFFNLNISVARAAAALGDNIRR